MKHPIIYFCFGGLALLVLLSAINKPYSSGAPSASTGAPAEQTCAMSGCHDDHGLNSGLAKLSIEVGKFGDNNNNGLPLTVKISDAQKIRFGFQVTALDEFNNKIGAFIVTDSSRTQKLGPKNDLPNREYLTYTYYGTLGTKVGESEWTMNWMPTENKPGKVTFYVAALSADNDGSDQGDYTYTAKASTSWETTLNHKIFKNSSPLDARLTQNQLSILNPQNTLIRRVTLGTINGTILIDKHLENNESHLNLPIQVLPIGIMIISLHTSEGIVTKKIFNTHD